MQTAKNPNSLKIVQAEPKQTTWREDRERQAGSFSLTEAIEIIIEAVDKDFLAALPRENVRETDVGHFHQIREVFRTSKQRDDEDEFLDVMSKADPEMEMGLCGKVYMLEQTFQNFYLAIGYAAGLRAAGASKATARTMLTGVLRNFDHQQKAHV